MSQLFLSFDSESVDQFFVTIISERPNFCKSTAFYCITQTHSFKYCLKNDKALDQLIKDARIDDLKAALPDKDNSLYMGYLRDLLYHPASADYSDFLITKFENEAEKDVSLSKMLAKIGPVLGLIGTLISMSPALVGLSTGDISGMAYNMQVVFATTVVGLVISAVGLISMQFKQRWYAKDVNNLDYVSRVLNETTGESNNEKK
jgi:hypothetical protein